MSKISRRSFIAAGTALGAQSEISKALLRGLSPAPQDAAEDKPKRPKNVLLLMTDQHRPDAMGIRGDPVAKTPNLDALARTGVSYQHAYCTYPVCAPSRSSMLTGCYVHRLKTFDNATPWPFDCKTVAHAFSQAGYMTGLIGKMHFVDGQRHGFDYNLDFNEWYQYLGPKTKLRAEEIFVPNSGSGLPQIDDLWRDRGDPWTGSIERDDRQGFVNVGHVSPLEEEDHFENFVARESIRFLRNHGTKQPFFLISSLLKPHDPFMPAARFANLFHAEDMKLSDTWGKVDLDTVPRFIRRQIHYDGATPELHDPEMAKLRMAMYYANLAQSDDCIGKVLSALDELGLAEDTIVLYTADHGEMLGAHGLWGKFVFYEPSAGVPLIWRVPGVTPQNVRAETPVSQVQLFPTLTELCGIPTPPNLPGASFAANLREPEKTQENTIFAEHGVPGNSNRGFMIRQGDFKYSYHPADVAELYDLRADPEEMVNLAAKPEYQAKVKELRAELFHWYNPERG